MKYPRLLWKGHGYRIIELSDAPVVFSHKTTEQPFCLERKTDTNALGGETWLPITEYGNTGNILIPALVEVLREMDPDDNDE